MISKPSRYDEVQVYEAAERLPVGGYVLKILGAKVEQYSWGNVLVLRFDISEGDHKSFYQLNYNAQTENKKWKGTYRINLPKNDGTEQDEWSIKKLKAAMTAVEKSNEGYTWDWNENSLVGRYVGGLFGNREWEMNGKRGFYTDCRSFCSVERIRSGNFQIPADKLLGNSTASTVSFGSSYDEYVPDGFAAAADDIPF